MNDSGEIMVFHLPMLHPWREPAKLPIVSVVRHPHFRSNEQDLPVVNDDTAVVDHVLVGDRPT